MRPGTPVLRSGTFAVGLLVELLLQIGRLVGAPHGGKLLGVGRRLLGALAFLDLTLGLHGAQLLGRRVVAR